MPCDKSSVSGRICNQRLAEMKKLRSPRVFISCFRSTAVLLEVKSCPIHNKYVAHWSGPAPTAFRAPHPPPPAPHTTSPFVVRYVCVCVRAPGFAFMPFDVCHKKQISWGQGQLIGNFSSLVLTWPGSVLALPQVSLTSRLFFFFKCSLFFLFLRHCKNDEKCNVSLRKIRN